MLFFNKEKKERNQRKAAERAEAFEQKKISNEEIFQDVSIRLDEDVRKGVKKYWIAAINVLMPNETIEFHTSGLMEGVPAYIFCTQKRIIVSYFGNGVAVKSIALKNVSSVSINYLTVTVMVGDFPDLITTMTGNAVGFMNYINTQTL